VEPVGFSKWKDYVLGNSAGPDGAIDRTPEWAEKICGVPSETIREFARLYAKSKPTHWNVSWSFARLAYGENPARAAAALQAMTGNIGISGGGGEFAGGWVARGAYRGVSLDWGRTAATYKAPTLFMNWKWADMVLLREKFESGELSKEQYHSMIGNPATNPTPNAKMLFTSKNIMNQNININKQRQAMNKLDFIVATTIHMTPTAKMADIVLPVADTMFEDYFFAGGPLYSPKLVNPPGEAKAKLWIDTKLAERLGVLDKFMPKYTSDDNFDAMIEDVYKAGFEAWAKANGVNLSWDEYKVKPIIRVEASAPYSVPLQDYIQKGKAFSTSSGKLEIYSKYLAETDLTKTKYGGPIAPMPVYEAPWDGFFDPQVNKYPLTCMTPHGVYRIHSVQDDNPSLRNETYRHAIWLSVSDAKVRGIKDGDMVRVFNDVGEMVIPAYVTSKIVPGTACLYQGAWFEPTASGVDRRGAPNALTHDKPNPSGAWPFHTNVEVEKF
jgi:anaerobic dimethyl sulfoxide reductase subunit A